jgi:hypothetical protein
MHRSAGHLLLSLVTASALWATDARAQPKDEPAKREDPPPSGAAEAEALALAAVAEALDLMNAGKADEAVTTLTKRFEACGACEASTRALVLSTLGVLYGTGKRDLERAQTIFEVALREDPTLELDREFAGKDVGKAFAEAQREVKKNPQGPGKGATRLPPTKTQLGAAREGAGQLASGNWSDCMGTLIGAMADSEFAEGKLALARCEEAGSLLLEAGRDATRALELAKAEGNAEVAAKATELLDKLGDETPRILVVVPPSIDSPEISIDGEKFSKEEAAKGIPRNPGKATVEVVGKKAGYPFNFKSQETVERGEKITVDVSQASGSQNSAVQQCLANAKTADEVALCLETGGKGRGLTFRGALEVASYNDTLHVDALSPGIQIGFENPAQGWLIGGSAVVDVVSAASPDIVATASRRFDQARFAGTLGGDVKIDVVRLGLTSAISYENDYTGRAVGAVIAADVLDKRLTPSLAYTLGYDTVGIAGGGYESDVFRHTVDVGASAVLSASTVLVGAGTFVAEDGDQSKPYRHIPFFTSDVAADVPRGATPRAVADARLPITAREQLPDSRLRGAVALGIRHRFEDSTLRADQRVYLDDWGLIASTTDGRFLIDATETTRVGPHVRFHVQGGVDFWQRAYVASAAGFPLSIPEYRTGDRELGPMLPAKVGGSIRQRLGEALALGLAVDGQYSQFLDHIFVFDRWGLFTASTLELVLE